MIHRGQFADGSSKEKGTAGEPKGQSGEPVNENFICRIIRNMSVWYDAVPQESGQVSVCCIQSDLLKGLTGVTYDGAIIHSESEEDTENFRKEVGPHF